MILSWRERAERVEARGLEYRARQITEAHFRAYLFSMHLRGEDITLKVREFEPLPRYSSEDKRLDSSRQWIDQRLGRKS